MHYIRFLKAPKAEVQQPWVIVKTLITITTDLGDDFLAAKLPIYALLIRDGDESEKKPALATASCMWKPGSRALWLVTSKLPISLLSNPVKMLISTSSEYARPLQVQRASLDHLPEVLHAWSEPFDLTDRGAMQWIERKLATSETVTLRICEEMGESIARHVWDAGVALAAFIRDIVLLPRLQNDDFLLANRLRMLPGPNVIELGSGCGIVGLQLAHVCSGAKVLLTDLPEAMEVLERNIGIAMLAPESQVSKAVLNWDKDVSDDIAKQTFDLVLVSDCTYNSDSIPALVRTLAFLTERSPAALVVVSMKVRHASEAIFHKLVAKAGLRECCCWTFEIPNERNGHACQESDKVYFYSYQSKRNFVEEGQSDIDHTA